MSMGWVATLALVLLLVIGGRAGVAQPLPPLAEYHFRTFDTADGLQSAYVVRIDRGGDGYLYVTHEEGVFRFDGEVFERVDMQGAEGRVLGWTKDAAGRLWLSARSEADGVRKIGVVEHGRFRYLPELETGTKHVRQKTVADSTLWLTDAGGLQRVRLTEDGVDMYRVSSPAEVPADSAVFVFLRSEGSAFRNRVQARHLVLVRPLSGDEVRVEPLRLKDCSAGKVVSTFNDARGIWLTGPEGTCLVTETQTIVVDPDTLSLKAFALRPVHYLIRQPAAGEPSMGKYLEEAVRQAIGDPVLLRGRHIAHLLYVPGGRSAEDTYWIVLEAEADEAGYLVRLRGGQVRVFALREVLDFHQIVDLSRDHEGSLWVATDKGIIQLAPRRALPLPPGPDLAEGFTTAIVQTRDEAVWVGTWGGGLHRYAEGRLTRRYTTADGLPSAMIRALYEATDGTLWVGTDLGAATIKDGRLRDIGLPPPATQVRSFTEEPDGTIWIADTNRLFRHAVDGTITSVQADLWRRNGLWAAHRARDGTLWVGTERGLFRSVGGRGFHEVDGLRGSYIVSVHEEPDGTLWFGTMRQGVYRYRPDSEGSAGGLANVTAVDGLHSDGIWRMLPDDLEGFWLSSNQGIAYVRQDDLHAAADASEAGRPIEHLQPLVFTEAEGLPSNECNRASPGGWRLTDGRLVFNNLRGFVVIEPGQALRPPPPPPAVLRQISADGQPVALGEEGGLPPGTRHVSFDFTALSFVAPPQNRYRYRLEGYDTEWIDGGYRPSAIYTNLAPGAYTFRVQSANGQGEWGEAAERAFAMQAFVWQTAWFRIAAVLAVIGVLALVYRARVRQLLREERIRLRIASDLHDDVGSSLSSIALLSEMVRERDATSEVAQGQLRRLHETATETVGALRDIIWLVDPAHDTVEDLVRKMRRVARDLLDGMACTFDTGFNTTGRVLDVVLMRALFLIYKEALHNIAKHACATRVEVGLELDERRVSLTVRDNGVGIDGAANGRGYGLESMQRRAEEAGGTLTILAPREGGTEVRFEARIA